MAKKRASIKGRGVDILFGEKVAPEKPALEIEREVDIEKLLGEEAELAAPELDADLEEAFGEEVTAMEPVSPTPVMPAEEPAPPRAMEIVSAPLEVPPSSKPRKVSVTLKMEEPSPPPAAPAPRVEEAPPTPTYPPVTPAPTVEAPSPPKMPPRRWEEAAYGPPPRMPEPAPAEAAPTAPPGRPLVSPYDRPPPKIKPGGYLVEHPVAVGEEAGLPTGVVPRQEREKRVETERAEEIPPQVSPQVSEMTVLSRLGEERQSNLFNAIDTLVVEAAQVLSVDKGLEDALSLLREARDISIERPRQFDQAEYRVAKVRAMLERKQNISRWSLIYGYPVLIYECVCFLLLLGSLLFDHSLAVFIANAAGTAFADMASLSMEHIFPLWNTMAWGGIGGVVGSLYSLYWHAAVEQDFDKQYLMWYIVQPVMGLILGGIVYLIIASGFISVQVLTAQATDFSEASQAMANPAIKAFHSVVACVAGFRQRFVFEMLDRIVQVLTPRPKTKAEREAEEAEEAAKKKTS
ncbi:MAG: hypothetical protein E3J21_24880 [Anaerolineales bacterium]|nr:MAG: hypothetical protein E3J21_24880 [Anaerolineales bacterium]